MKKEYSVVKKKDGKIYSKTFFFYDTREPQAGTWLVKYKPDTGLGDYILYMEKLNEN